MFIQDWSEKCLSFQGLFLFRFLNPIIFRHKILFSLFNIDILTLFNKLILISTMFLSLFISLSSLFSVFPIPMSSFLNFIFSCSLLIYVRRNLL